MSVDYMTSQSSWRFGLALRDLVQRVIKRVIPQFTALRITNIQSAHGSDISGFPAVKFQGYLEVVRRNTNGFHINDGETILSAFVVELR